MNGGAISRSATLSYLAAAYGVMIGFPIIFLFSEFSSARQAIGNEATSIGTAFDVGLAAVFTAVMVLIVSVLSTPFKQGVGSLAPELIEDTTALMESQAPDAAARPCGFEQDG